MYKRQIYGHNQEQQRQPLWDELQQNSLAIPGAWCPLGDFNTILCKEDRYGGNEVVDHDIEELSNFITNCEVLEMPSLELFSPGKTKLFGAKLIEFLSTAYGTRRLTIH